MPYIASLKFLRHWLRRANSWIHSIDDCINLRLCPIPPKSQRPKYDLVTGSSQPVYPPLIFRFLGSDLMASNSYTYLLNPLAFAEWVGTLITFLNVLTVGRRTRDGTSCGYVPNRLVDYGSACDTSHKISKQGDFRRHLSPFKKQEDTCFADDCGFHLLSHNIS